MAVSVAEQRQVLTQLHSLGVEQLRSLWRRAEGQPNFRQFLVEAFPEVVGQWSTAAGEVAAQWYDDEAPELAYRATAAPAPPVEQLASSATWALNTTTGTDALTLLSGTLQRAVWNTARETVIQNAESERGARWARHASANACEFCRMLATRGAVYASAESATRVGGRGRDIASNFDPVTGRKKRGGQARGVRTRGSQGLGSKYHDHCHCISVMVRPGRSYEPPSYVEKWEQEYIAASRETDGSTKAVLAHMRQNAI
jgi:hypothetical protein